MSPGEYIPPAELLASDFGQFDQPKEGHKNDSIHNIVPAMWQADKLSWAELHCTQYPCLLKHMANEQDAMKKPNLAVPHAK